MKEKEIIKAIIVLLTIVLIGITVFYGCRFESDNHSNSKWVAPTIEVVTLDSCEYLKFHVYGFPSYTHKGNCTNSIHVYNRP